MGDFDDGDGIRYDPTYAKRHAAWERELRRRGLSSRFRIWYIARRKARAGKRPPKVD